MGLGLLAFGYMVSAQPAASISPESQVVGRFANLQRLDWQSVGVERASSVLGIQFATGSPRIAESCAGAISYSGDLLGARVVLEFDQVHAESRCARKLIRATALLRLTNNEAHIAEVDLRVAVKAGGHACSTDGADEYEWRSVDSLRRYLLRTVIHTTSTPARPESPAELKIGLEQTSVTPSEVDDLPFERGFVPRCP